MTITNQTTIRKTTYMLLCLTKKEFSESFKNNCSKQETQVYFKEGNITKNYPMVPKEKDTITQKVV